MHRLLLLFLLLTLVGCDNAVSPPELRSYVRDPRNGLQQSIVSRDIKVGLMYKPTDLLVSQEINVPLRDEGLVTSLRNKYSTYHYFILSFSRNRGEISDGSSDPSSLIRKLAFQMSDYVKLTTSAGDTVSVADFAMDRTFGLASSTNILLAFRRSTIQEGGWIQINLKEIGLGIGEQRFRFLVNDIVRAPDIEFK
jgi:DNA-binding transcriptional ArsR family regulator